MSISITLDLSWVELNLRISPNVHSANELPEELAHAHEHDQGCDVAAPHHGGHLVVVRVYRHMIGVATSYSVLVYPNVSAFRLS